MTPPAPNIDQRTASDIAGQVQHLIRIYVPEQPKFDPATGMSGALVGVFARFAEIIGQRLNQVPQKNFLAFLDLLGAALLPPQPARVPLTFSLAAGSTVDGLVPVGTQVAAPPAEGEQEPVIFETERELTVTAAQLTALFVRDPEQDTYTDHSALIASPSGGEALLFRGNRRIEHILYIGHSQLLGFPVIEHLRLDFHLTSLPRDIRILQWEFWDGTQWQDITPPPAQDQTNNLQQSGTIAFGAMTAVPSTSVNALQNRWLRCRLLTPITRSAEKREGMERASQLPRIQTLQMAVDLNRAGLNGEAAFTNLLPVDVSKDFFPFGEKPKFGDTLWLAHREAFSMADAIITLFIDLVNPTNARAVSPPPVSNSANPELRWEVWNGTEWVVMDTSALSGPQSPIANAFVDTTEALTTSGQVSFKLPSHVAATSVNGVENFWVRVRLISGDYGQEARYEPVDPKDPTKGYNFFPATFAPPVIRSLKVNYSLSQAAAPEAVQTFNDFVYEDVTPTNNDQDQSFAPFRATEDVRPTFYLSFTLPPDRVTFPNRTLTLFGHTAEVKYGERTVPLSPERSTHIGAPASVVRHTFVVTDATALLAQCTFRILGTQWPSVLTVLDMPPGDATPPEVRVEVQVTIPAGTPPGSSDRGFLQLEIATQPGLVCAAEFVTSVGAEAASSERLQLAWEYWDGQQWSALTVRDDTENFTRPGPVEFLAPPDFTIHSEFDQPPRYWLRVRREKGAYVLAPRLRRMLLNTTMAAQTEVIRDEVLGSSDGSGGQTFRSTQAPILLGQRLEVREPEMPAAAELEVITREEGADAITLIPDAAGRPREIWVRWHEVQDFYGSRPRSRHYVLDHLTGEIRTGDGLHGLIPPIGRGNLRLARYHTGGGSVGNRPAGTIVQLKTTVPYVDKVTNTDAAAGGADAETLDSLLVRAPRTIRHGGRAVTVEDYEDLAMLASPAVARARCVPLRNLLADPLGAQPTKRGEVSVIIVPRSHDAKPQPSLELLRRVQDYLEAHSIPTAHVAVVGPLYIRVDVSADVALTELEGASAVAQAVQQKLASFLHPLTGGLDGAGWDFGRRPHRSDLYALIEAVPGVDHLRSLVIEEKEDLLGVSATGRFLVFSGTHTIRLVFEEA